VWEPREKDIVVEEPELTEGTISDVKRGGIWMYWLDDGPSFVRPEDCIPILRFQQLVEAVVEMGYEVKYSGTVDPDFQELTGTQVIITNLTRDEQGCEVGRKIIAVGESPTFQAAIEAAILKMGEKEASDGPEGN